MAKFTINVDVNGKASIDDLDNNLKKLDKTAQNTSSAFDSLKNVIAAVGFYELAKKTIAIADTMNLLEGRVSLVTKSLQEQIAVQKELFKVAQNTRQGLEATTQLYTNLAGSMTAMGKSQSDIIKMTETVNKAMIVSGSSTSMAQAAITQLGQAFASGTLRGDELNSIMENAKGLSKAIADGMGVPIGKLRELGSQGKITSEILAAALEKSAKSVDDQFAKLPQTVGQSMTQVENSVMALVGSTDDAVNGSGGLSEIFSHFSKYLDGNQAEVVEFGRDFLRVMQLVGAGALTLFSGIMTMVDGIAGGIIGAVELSINGVLFFINSAIATAEMGYNKIRSLGGFDEVKLGRIAKVDLGSKNMFANMKRQAEDANVGLKTMGTLFNEIANDTTTIKKNFTDLDTKPGKTGGAQGTKGKDSKAKKSAKEETLEERLADHKKAQDAMTAIQDKYYADIAKKESDRETATNNMYQSLLQVQGDWYTSDSIRLGEQFNEWKKAGVDKLALQEWLNTSILSLDDKRAKEQKSAADTILKEQKERADALAKDIENSFKFNIEFDTTSLEGVPKAIAGVSKAMGKLAQESTQYEENKKKFAKGSEAYAKNEEDHTKSQIAGFSEMAGAASAMFKQGSAEAEAFGAIQSGLAVVNAVTAVMNAGTNGDGYTAVARMLAVAATASSFLSQIGQSLSGGGSASTSPPPDSTQGTTLGGDPYSQSESINNITDLLKDIHVSEYSELRSINRAVTSMAQGIVGTATNLARSGVLDTSGVQLGSSKGGSPLQILGKLRDPVTAYADKLFNKVFGSSKVQSIRGSGLDISAGTLGQKTEGDVGASSFVDIETKKRKRWGSTSYSYNKTNTALDEATSNSLALVYKSFSDTMKAVDKGLGTKLGDVISNYQFDAVSMNLKGLSGEQVTKKISDMFSAQGDKMATSIFGNVLLQYQNLGEGLLETAVRVITEKAVVLQELGNIGIAVSGDVIGVSQSLVTLSGSLSNFQDSVASYYDKFFSDTEKQANTQKTLIDLFETLDISMPSTTQAFRSIVEALDMTTLSGQEAFTTLMGVSGKFFDFTREAERITQDAADRAMEITQAAADEANKLAKIAIDDADKLAKEAAREEEKRARESERAAERAEKFADDVRKAEKEAIEKAAQEAIRLAKETSDAISKIISDTSNSFKNLKSSTIDLRDSLSASASADPTTLYLTQFQDLKKEFMGNFDASGIVYKDSIEKMESDYAKLTSTISSLSGVGTTEQKSGLIGQLDIFGEMFDKNAKAMNVFIVGDSTTGQTQESSTINMIQWINSLKDGSATLPPRGFASGGYTGDMGTDQVAGVTHGQEYVVNAQTTRDLGLNNSGGMFRDMVNEIRNLKNEVVRLNQVAMSQLREAIGGNVIMRQVTNGGNAMMIEVI